MKQRNRKQLEELLQKALAGQDISRDMSNEQIQDVFEITMDLAGDGKHRIDGREVSVEDYQQWVMQQQIAHRQAGSKFFQVTLNI